MLGMILSWLGGPIVSGAISAYKAKLEAGQTQDRLAADLAARELAVDQRQRELNAEVVRSEQGRWYTACIRPLFAMPFIIFTWKVVVWDKVLGWGATDKLTGDVSAWAGYVILAYFGGRSLEKAARIFTSRK
jgi:hypothetical protein